MRIMLALSVYLPLAVPAEVVTVDFVEVMNGNTE